MRILHAYKDYYPPTRGGIEQHVHDLVHGLPGVECAVLTSARSRRSRVDDDAGVPVFRAGELARVGSSPVTPSWVRLLREVDADIVHLHLPHPVGELAALAARTACPIVVTYHADVVGRRAARAVLAPARQRFLARAERILVTSPAMRDTAPLGPHRDRTVIVPLGVDPGEWRHRPAQAADLRARYPGPLVVFLGRLVPYKGVDVLIQAMRSVPATALVIGDGRCRRELERAAVGSRVIFVGAVPDAGRAAYYHAADVVVLPSVSRAEAFGMAMLEAMACGTPVVCTELGTGTSWLNRHGRTGLVVPPRDPATLAQALRRLLADDQLRHRMGGAATERVRHHFTRHAMSEQITDVYRQVIT
jgi:rhamnosyl/mannosyltransferase